MIQNLKTRDFRILDEGVKAFMRINKIGHLKFNIYQDDGVYISVTHPDYENTLTFDRSWRKVHWGKRVVCVRTPSFLIEHIGKDVEIYQDKALKKKNELFRIRPIDFDLIKSDKKRRVKISTPYFTRQGEFVVPRDYLTKNKIRHAFSAKASFNRTDPYLVGEGLILGRILHGEDYGNAIYSLRECSNGVRTRRVNSLLDILNECGKEIHKFQFLETTRDEEYDYDLMVFREVKFDGS